MYKYKSQKKTCVFVLETESYQIVNRYISQFEIWFWYNKVSKLHKPRNRGLHLSLASVVKMIISLPFTDNQNMSKPNIEWNDAQLPLLSIGFWIYIVDSSIQEVSCHCLLFGKLEVGSVKNPMCLGHVTFCFSYFISRRVFQVRVPVYWEPC